ncbi:hypothetical protein ACH4M4_25330 [Streptomyces sp. NPDC017254]|uniref:hypothetical protein n=1 Tax=unclassified Streptomyces TaxID=2593676 RepID=UPI0037922372
MVAQTSSPRLDVATLTESQRDGVACVACNGDRGRMVPVGTLDGVQLFEHPSCAAGGVTNGFIAVIGDTSTPEAYDATCAAGMDVADRLQIPARILVGMGHDVLLYEGAVILDTYLDSVASAVLGMEAREGDMMSLDYGTLMAYPMDYECGHCMERDETAQPRRIGDEWTTSVCDSCVDHATA